MRLSIVIPTIGRPSLARALERLAAQESPPQPFEVLVVEDGSSPAGATAQTCTARDRPYALRVLRAARPGASAARNLGWQAAQAPVVLFLGDDILGSPTLLAEHLAAHDRHPEEEIGVLGAVEWASELTRTTFMRWLENGIQFDFRTIRGEEAGWWRLYTANCSLKRVMLDAVGGFDEETFPFLYEDLDLGRRMSDRLGFRLMFNPRARGEHLHRMTREEWEGRVRILAPAELRFVRRHPDFEPYFFNLFREAAAAPRALGVLARLAPIVPPEAPGIGRLVWASVDRRNRQALAPTFLKAWDQALAESR